MENVRIAIFGAGGCMGNHLVRAVKQIDGLEITAILVRSDFFSNSIKLDKLKSFFSKKVFFSENLNNIIDKFDVLVDFSSPTGISNYLPMCRKYKKPLVIGTTGFNQSEKQIIYEVSKELPVVFSANFSIGINLVLKLLEKVTKVLGESVDVEIIEKHHRRKLDAPSGTALVMGKVIADVMKWGFDENSIYNHINHIGERKERNIAFSSIRAGDIVGEHTVMFVNKNESLEITHKAFSRMVFALGALKSAIWIHNKNPGFYKIQDILN